MLVRVDGDERGRPRLRVDALPTLSVNFHRFGVQAWDHATTPPPPHPPLLLIFLNRLFFVPDQSTFAGATSQQSTFAGGFGRLAGRYGLMEMSEVGGACG